MTLPPAPDRWTIELANAERMEAIAAFGFTERQARFLLNVLLHSGVFVERQYLQLRRHRPRPEEHGLHQDARRAAIRDADHHWQAPSRANVPRPLQAALGGHRRARQPVPEADRSGTHDRARHAPRCCARRSRLHMARPVDWTSAVTSCAISRIVWRPRDYPHLLFGDGPEKAVRYFPDKLPIGMQPYAHPHVFVYLVTRPSPMDFRLFLLRHTALLRVAVPMDGPAALPSQTLEGQTGLSTRGS